MKEFAKTERKRSIFGCASNLVLAYWREGANLITQIM